MHFASRNSLWTTENFRTQSQPNDNAGEIIVPGQNPTDENLEAYAQSNDNDGTIIAPDPNPLEQYPPEPSPPGSPIEQFECSTNEQQRTESDLKRELNIFVSKLLSEKNTEFLEHNLAIMKKMKFTDFEVKIKSQKRTVDKQNDFMKKTKFTKTQQIQLNSFTFQQDSDEPNENSENLINTYLSLLCLNFSSTEHKVFKELVTTGQRISELEDCHIETEKYGSNAITFIPFCRFDDWGVIIVSSDGLKRYEKHDLGYEKSRQSVFSILLQCTQELTQYRSTHTDILLKRFENFLKEILVDSVDVLHYCYCCYEESKISCAECGLTFCDKCLKKPFVCKRCK